MTEANRTLESAKQVLEKTLDKTIQRIEELGELSDNLYLSLDSIQNIFDDIRGFPDEKRLQYQTLQQMREAWKTEAETILKEAKEGTKNSMPGMSGLEIGYSTLAVSPTLASGLATCFETLTLGILAPSLGGFPTLALAIAIGSAPIVDPISLLLTYVIWSSKKTEKECIQYLFTRIYNRNIRSYKRAIIEINERIKRMENEKARLDRGIETIKSFGTNYREMTEEQKYELGTYMNLMLSATALVVNPIVSLKPYYSNSDFDDYILCLNEMQRRGAELYYECTDDKKKKGQLFSKKDSYLLAISQLEKTKSYVIKNKPLVIYLCNQLYKIQLDEKEKKLLCRCLKGNEDFAKSYSVEPSDINKDLLEVVIEMLRNKDQ